MQFFSIHTHLTMMPVFVEDDYLVTTGTAKISLVAISEQLARRGGGGSDDDDYYGQTIVEHASHLIIKYSNLLRT